ncbi:MAG TPA: hypothetical protein VFY06_04165, partial [Verrucomicrobiae bacterium]|nr:hypothetical protein [Verrucomicrobiae bacterium]
AMAVSLFSKHGVDLTVPGRNVAYNYRLGLLYVRATPMDLDSVERVVQTLNQVIPQIHIKARFIEVPKQGFVAPTPSNAVRGQMTGIMSDPEFRTALQTLEHQNRAEVLAEPECVTTSGRQTQMRATDFDEVLTNYALVDTTNHLTAFSA